MDNVDPRAFEHSVGEPCASYCSDDNVRDVEVSLGSMDTPERARIHDESRGSEQRDDITTILSPRLGADVVGSPIFVGSSPNTRHSRIQQLLREEGRCRS